MTNTTLAGTSMHAGQRFHSNLEMPSSKIVEMSDKSLKGLATNVCEELSEAATSSSLLLNVNAPKV